MWGPEARIPAQRGRLQNLAFQPRDKQDTQGRCLRGRGLNLCHHTSQSGQGPTGKTASLYCVTSEPRGPLPRPVRVGRARRANRQGPFPAMPPRGTQACRRSPRRPRTGCPRTQGWSTGHSQTRSTQPPLPRPRGGSAAGWDSGPRRQAPSMNRWGDPLPVLGELSLLQGGVQPRSSPAPWSDSQALVGRAALRLPLSRLLPCERASHTLWGPTRDTRDLRAAAHSHGGTGRHPR